MSGLDSVFGWLAIGSAASLAALMWPFLRGAKAVVVKLVLGPLGAVVGALLSRLAAPDERAIAQLFFAAAGSIAVLLSLQLAWQRYSRSKTLTA
jgi:uncharacterized membrane protein YeaQ/YmgE (transglycosylase-associated protein family)